MEKATSRGQNANMESFSVTLFPSKIAQTRRSPRIRNEDRETLAESLLAFSIHAKEFDGAAHNEFCLLFIILA